MKILKISQHLKLFFSKKKLLGVGLEGKENDTFACWIQKERKMLFKILF